MNTVHFTLLWPVHTYSIDMQGAFWDAYIDMYERSVLFTFVFVYYFSLHFGLHAHTDLGGDKFTCRKS